MLGTKIRRKIVSMLPLFLRVWLGKLLQIWRGNINSKRDTGEIFDEIYQKGLWGGESGKLCSGHGSVENSFGAYTSYVAEFIDDLPSEIPCIIDIGCGDFSVGSHILTQLNRSVHYIGVDVAPTVIEHHKSKLASLSFPVSHKIEFICADASRDNLPRADLCLIRQVFQHLSNSTILDALENLSDIPYMLISEEQVINDPKLVPNKDKVNGPYTRLSEHSGVYLDKPPFSLSNVTWVLGVALSPKAAINTFLVHKQPYWSEYSYETA